MIAILDGASGSDADWDSGCLSAATRFPHDFAQLQEFQRFFEPIMRHDHLIVWRTM